MQLRSYKTVEHTHEYLLEEMENDSDSSDEFQTADEKPARMKFTQHDAADALEELISTLHLYASLFVACVAGAWKKFILTSYFYTLLSIVSILVIAALSHSIYKCTHVNTSVIFSKICRNVLAKQKIFPSQNSIIWYDICSGFKNLATDPSRPAVYLLMFEENALASSSCIAEIITTSANQFIFGRNQWLLLNGTSLSRSRSKDPGILIETLAEHMEYSRIVVVTDIQKIPAKLAQGFHFLVDQYNPKISDAVFIFTMMVPHHQSQPNTFVSDILTNSWSELDDDIRQALIVRVSDSVLPILQEDVTLCPLKINSTIEISIP